MSTRYNFAKDVPLNGLIQSGLDECIRYHRTKSTARGDTLLQGSVSPRAALLHRKQADGSTITTHQATEVEEIYIYPKRRFSAVLIDQFLERCITYHQRQMAEMQGEKVATKEKKSAHLSGATSRIAGERIRYCHTR
jgi:hypothetical protein